MAANSDVNMFLTRHRLLHPSVPHLPLSISHCWINADLEREKLRLGDLGFSESPAEIEQLKENEEEVGGVGEKLPDMFKTKANLDRRPSQEPVASEVSSISSVGATKPVTTRPPNSGPKAPGANGGSRPGSIRGKKDKDSVILLKDRDWRGGDEGEMWWECQWDGMDGIGGTNKKGAKCFDKVRITWGWSME
jgi:hypothetical protein